MAVVYNAALARYLVEAHGMVALAVTPNVFLPTSPASVGAIIAPDIAREPLAHLSALLRIALRTGSGLLETGNPTANQLICQGLQWVER